MAGSQAGWGRGNLGGTPRMKRGTAGRLGERRPGWGHAELQVWVAQPNGMPNSGGGETEVITRQARAEIRRQRQRRARDSVCGHLLLLPISVHSYR